MANSKTVIITGGGGFVGSQYFQHSNHQILAPGRNECDLNRPDSLKNYLNNHHCQTLINFAAFTDMDDAEQQRNDKNGSAWQINVEGVHYLTDICRNKIYLIHISTDAVFPGSKLDPGPYGEIHPTATESDTVSWYGWTKNQGEKLLLKNGKRCSIVRIAWPVGDKPHPKDYLQKLISRAKTNQLPPLFTNQYLTLSFIPEVAAVLDVLIERQLSGIFHASSKNSCTPYQVAQSLFKRLHLSQPISPIKFEDFVAKAQFPKRYHQFSGLKVASTTKKLNLHFSTWQQIITKLINS